MIGNGKRRLIPLAMPVTSAEILGDEIVRREHQNFERQG